MNSKDTSGNLLSRSSIQLDGAIKTSPGGMVGFVGMAERGPITPHIIHSWVEYTGLYGSYHDNNPLLYLPFSIKGYFENGGGFAYVVRVVSTEARSAELNVCRMFKIQASGPGTWGNQIFIRIRPQNINTHRSLGDTRYQVTVLYFRVCPKAPPGHPWKDESSWPSQLYDPDEREEYENLELDSHGQNSLSSVINQSSKLIRIQPLDVTRGQEIQMDSFLQLQNGDDGSDPTEGSFLGHSPSGEVSPLGLASLESIENISLICAPDHVHEQLDGAIRVAVTQGLLDFCERNRNCLAILSIEKNKDNVQEVLPPSRSRYGAVYYPWIRVDGLSKNQGVLVPPVGHIAGVMTRIDHERGLYTAPVNAMLRGIVKDGNSPLEFVTTKQHQGLLNDRGVNVIRDFRTVGGGIRVWGVRTMSQDPYWQYIHVQRFGMFLEAAIQERFVSSAVHPVPPSMLHEVIQSVSHFLENQWLNGGLAGRKKEEAFFIECASGDFDTKSSDHDTVAIKIGVALLEPSEFLIFRFDHLLKPIR